MTALEEDNQCGAPVLKIFDRTLGKYQPRVSEVNSQHPLASYDHKANFDHADQFQSAHVVVRTP